MLRLQIVLYFIFYCLQIQVNPWRFFQVHAELFDSEKGIFSKYDIEKYIPKKWKIESYLLDQNIDILDWKNEIEKNTHYPIFLKPEWGQNSHGIFRVDREKDLEVVLRKIKKEKSSYLYQQGSKYEREIEIFFIRESEESDFLEFSITEVINIGGGKHPVNGIHGDCEYKDINSTLSEKQIAQLKKYISKIKYFKVARVGLKVKNIENLLDGIFEIFEVNIFIPLPLSILDSSLSKNRRQKFLQSCMKNLAYITKKVIVKKYKNIFFRKLFKHYQTKLYNSKVFRIYKNS